MPDICDMAQDIIEQELERNLAKTKEPYALPEGKSADCDLCGEWSSRTIDGVCAPCRDFYHLP